MVKARSTSAQLLIKALVTAFKRYRSKLNREDAREWFGNNYDRICQIFEDERVRDHIFGPFRILFQSFQNTTEGQVKAVITQVAVANAVLAGLPGKLGVGIYVCMALEAYMALRIAAFVDVKLDKPSDIFKYVGVISGVALTIGWLFTHLLRGTFSLLSLIPVDIPLTVISELLVTNLVGILFWFAFQEVAQDRAFRVPRRMMGQVLSTTRDLLKFQIASIREVISLENLKSMASRLTAWVKGDSVALEVAQFRGEAFVAAATAAFVHHRFSELNGPLGDIFLKSIRDIWSSQLPDASLEEIALVMKGYEPDQIGGVLNVIKGKMFEHLVERHENADGDEWKAYLHDDQNYPGSDITFVNPDTGEEIEISLKAVSDPALIETALMRYPDIPIVTNVEMREAFADDDRVIISDISDEKLERNVQDLFDDLIRADGLWETRVDATLGIGAGTAAATILRLWPFAAAYIRSRIDSEQLAEAFQKILGDSGKILAGRIVLAAAFGPIYIWYLLARGVMQLTPTLKEEEKPSLRLEYMPS